MKIQSLTLHGFKSFPDRTRIDLHEGITAIVGPNGCGKSNISDALRWVLGEQRPTAIRGTRMEEAIFEGTAERRPIHRAEVALSLSNEDSVLPVPYSEVVIGRTVHRGGEGEYSLNGVPCRLKDLQDMCRDTGLGANAYSIIEARMIDAILSDRAEERRSLFEEAAQIGRYKDRRRTALRRLEQADIDLKRLDDLLVEVESKVRSLVRQRGKAERFGQLRARRLQLEVAVAEARLNHLERRLGEAEAKVERLRSNQPSREAELRTEELAVEKLRLRLVERERERSELARLLESARARLEELERQRLVAGERASAAEERRGGLLSELAELENRLAETTEELAELRQAAELRSVEIGSLRERVEEARRTAEAAQGIRDERKRAEEEALSELAEVIRSVGPLEAERVAVHERTEERRAELERRRAERKSRTDLVAGLEGQLETEEAGVRSAAAGRADLETRIAAARKGVWAQRAAVREAADRLAALEGELSAERARADGLQALLTAGKDLPTVIGELLGERGALPGVHGVLADSLRVPADQARAVESLFGLYLYGVVVEDWRAVQAVREWLAARGAGNADEGGGILLLPLDPGPRAPGVGAPALSGAPLLERIEVAGPGAPWARALLAGVAAREEGDFAPAGGAWVLPDGSGQDRLGALRIGQPGAGRGVLSRRSELAEVKRRVARLEADREKLTEALRSVEEELEARNTRLDALDAHAVQADRRLREAEARRESTAERLERAREQARELDGRISELEGMLESAESRAATDRQRLVDLRARRQRAEETLAELRLQSLEVTAEWEREGSALNDLLVELARYEADAEAAAERARRDEGLRVEIEERIARLQRELAELDESVQGGRSLIRESEEELAGLLEERGELEARLRSVQETMDDERRELEERESALRAARRDERELAERRHATELEIAELRGQRSTIRERLEAEWEAGFEELRERVEPPQEGGPAEWARELEEIRERLNRMGPVNLLAAQEYAEQKERLDFLQGQRADLVTARDDLLDSIRRINETAAAAFNEVFEKARENFQRIFVTLFEGGEADVWLEDPEDPLDSPIEIAASPRGKKVQRINLLSGGERALTALALLFGIYLTKPSPFCVMDEVDAPLDESNIGRFTALLDRFKPETQFIVITHNPRTIESADWIYGVTMQEPGVSSIVGVELQGLPRGQVA